MTSAEKRKGKDWYRDRKCCQCLRQERAIRPKKLSRLWVGNHFGSFKVARRDMNNSKLLGKHLAPVKRKQRVPPEGPTSFSRLGQRALSVSLANHSVTTTLYTSCAVNTMSHTSTLVSNSPCGKGSALQILTRLRATSSHVCKYVEYSVG